MTSRVSYSSRLTMIFGILLVSLLLSGCPTSSDCPGALADYQVIHEPTHTIDDVGDTFVIEFELPPGALFINGPQQPFITYNISMLAFPAQEIEITLNGTTLDTHSYSSNLFVSSKTVLAPGSAFIATQNSLEFSRVSGSSAGPLGIEISDVIVHFQQDICGFVAGGDAGPKEPDTGSKN